MNAVIAGVVLLVLAAALALVVRAAQPRLDRALRQIDDDRRFREQEGDDRG